MARIAGVDLPRNKSVKVGLTYIYGIGNVTSDRILAEAGVDPNIRSDDLTESQVAQIRSVIDNDCIVEGELRKTVSQNIKQIGRAHV